MLTYHVLRDSVTISVDAVVYYQVSNPLSAICNNDDYNRSTRLLAQTTLRLGNVKAVDLYIKYSIKRNILGTKNLSEILSDRETIGDVRQTFINNFPHNIFKITFQGHAPQFRGCNRSLGGSCREGGDQGIEAVREKGLHL